MEGSSKVLLTRWSKFRRTNVVLLGSAIAGAAVGTSCQTLSQDAPLSVTKASATNSALRHVWTIDDFAEVQSFLRGDQANNTWKMEAPLSGEDSGLTSASKSSVSAISWVEGTSLHERAYYVNPDGALRAVAYDGTTRRYITDTMAAIPGVALTGALSSVVYNSNERVVVGIGIPSGSTRHLYMFRASAASETSYAAQDLGSPTGIDLAFGNDVVASATDTLSYCAFSVTAIPPAQVAAIGVSGVWHSFALPGGKQANKSMSAVR